MTPDDEIPPMWHENPRLPLDKYEFLISLINKKEDIREISRLFPDTNWVIVGNFVFDITDLEHPGGNYIFNKIKGRDVSKYFNGSDFLEDCSTAARPNHLHSTFAYNYLKERFIGMISHHQIFTLKEEYEPSFIVSKDSKGFDKSFNSKIATNSQDGEEDVEEYGSDWRIAHFKRTSKNFSTLYLRNSELNIKAQPMKLPNFGCHAKIKIIESKSCFGIFQKKAFNEYETGYIALSLIPENLSWRRNIVDYVEAISDRGKSMRGLIQPRRMANYFPLVIKNGSFDGIVDGDVRNFEENHNWKDKAKNNLLALPFENDSKDESPKISLLGDEEPSSYGKKKEQVEDQSLNYSIRGPEGPGLNLSRFSIGTICCFVQGGGELAFVDLLDFILKKLCYNYIYDKVGRKEAHSLDIGDCEFDISLENDINFIFFVSVKNFDDSVSLPLLNKIIELQQKLGQRKIVTKCIARVSEFSGKESDIVSRVLKNKFGSIEFTQQYFSEEAIKSNLNEIYFEDIERIIISGCGSFSRDVRDSIGKIEASLRDKIRYV